jgi:hypothetical protein
MDPGDEHRDDRDVRMLLQNVRFRAVRIERTDGRERKAMILPVPRLALAACLATIALVWHARLVLRQAQD